MKKKQKSLFLLPYPYFLYQLKKKPIDSNASIFQNRLPFPRIQEFEDV